MAAKKSTATKTAAPKPDTPKEPASKTPELLSADLTPAKTGPDPAVTPPKEVGSKDEQLASKEKQQPAPVETPLAKFADVKPKSLEKVGLYDELAEKAEVASQKAEDAKIDVSQVRTAGGWAAGVSPSGQRTYTTPADGLSVGGQPQINSPAEGVSVIARPEDPVAVPEGTQPLRYDHAPYVVANPNGDADNTDGAKELKNVKEVGNDAAAERLGWHFEETAEGEINAFKPVDGGMVEFHGKNVEAAVAAISYWENHESRRAVTV